MLTTTKQKTKHSDFSLRRRRPLPLDAVLERGGGCSRAGERRRRRLDSLRCGHEHIDRRVQVSNRKGCNPVQILGASSGEKQN